MLLTSINEGTKTVHCVKDEDDKQDLSHSGVEKSNRCLENNDGKLLQNTDNNNASHKHHT